LELSKPPIKSSKAILAIGMCLNAGYHMPQNLVAGFAAFKRAAEAGNPDGMWEVLRCYEEGEGEPAAEH
jgi:TPR repeat protein